jgi:hypothetical protein
MTPAHSIFPPRLFPLCLALPAFFALFFSACTPQGELSPAAKELVQGAVFEVVIWNPNKMPDSAVYEKPLDWDDVPYQIRTDDYYSIGTAFAISDTTLITAFHVMDLSKRSAVNGDYYFVRSANGAVCEAKDVLAADSERDFLVFTVKDCAPFPRHFEFDTTASPDDAVYSIGNAWGEGIVTRGGLVLGTVPEPEQGRWQILKSSAGINPGNSGGPLITPDGRVVALVTSKKDNILYSTPAGAILERGGDSLYFRVKPTYSHYILANTLTREFKWSAPLPAPYESLLAALDSAYRQEYAQAMEQLFAEAPEYLSGPNNAYLFASSYSPRFPQFDNVDPNDDNWKINEVAPEEADLLHNGKLWSLSLGDFTLYRIRRPANLPADSLRNPQTVMDLILRNRRIERVLWENPYRVVSYGPLFWEDWRTDALGRKWKRAAWRVPWNDAELLLHLLPLPDGVVAVMGNVASSDRFMYAWDIEKLIDHLHIAYQGTFAEWKEFAGDSVFQGGKLSLPGFSVDLSSRFLDWNDDSRLSLSPFYRKVPGSADSIRWSTYEACLSQSHRQLNYAVWTRHARPDPRLGDDYQDAWQDIVAGRFPFDGKPALSSTDNSGQIVGVLPAGDGEPCDSTCRWTAMLVEMENPSAHDLRARFKKMLVQTN